MENFLLLFQGFTVAAQPDNILMALVGCVLGLIVGAMPGIGSLAGCALLLPLTFRMNPTMAIIMLAAIYYANMYGGAFSAILLNIPGDSPAIMTALDGYPLTQKGKAGKALFIANFSSFIGGTIGIILLTVLAPALARIGLRFGPAEMVSLLLFALTSIGWMLGDDPKKGIVATFLGILLALVGLDPIWGLSRFTFGNVNLLSGFTFIPMVIGMFGFSQVIEMHLNKQDFSFLGGTKLTIKESLPDKSDIISILPVTLRGGIMGTFLGILPGAGATIASFLSYMFNKQISKKRAKFGTGIVEGVAAAESANNAAAAGAFAPLLSLGIPGSGTAAVLLGGLMMWGLKPGPQLFTQEPDFVWGLIASMYIGNIICIVIAIAIIPFLVRILCVPTAVMAPIIMVLCVVGSYSANNNIFDVYIMLGAGILAYLMNVAKIPIAPLLLTFVLAPMLEQFFVQTLQVSKGNFSLFVTKPISLFLLICMALFIICPVVYKKFIKKPSSGSDVTNILP